MSRFEEVVNEAIGEVVLGESTFKAETLAEHIAQLVRARQDARRAEVTIEARFPEHKPAPVSGIQTQELYTLHGSAASTELGTRRLIGVTAQGMTACPCAQELVAADARERLQARASTTTRSKDPRRRAGRDPQPARPRHAAHRLHRAVRRRDRRRAPCSTIVEHADVLGDLRADEALRRGARRREGPPPARASSRTACGR